MKLLHGDCIEKIKELEDNSIDSIVTDPPYELGFMGKSWDSTGIANNVELWKECLRVLKPGGHLLAFSGTRTYHRMTCAIEDAGFEVRDMIEWVYGSGFPKSLNIGKAVDKLQGNEREEFERNDGAGNKQDYISSDRTKSEAGVFGGDKKVFKDSKGTSEWEGWGTALKPAHEPICMARKPLSEKTVAENCLKWGTGGLNIDESRVGTEELTYQKVSSMGKTGEFSGQGLTRENGGLVVTGKQTVIGRFPANLILGANEDGQVHEEVRECFPELNNKSGGAFKKQNIKLNSIREGGNIPNGYDDSGNASRFFKSIIYQAKASKSERNAGCDELDDKLGGSLEGGNDKRNGDKPQLKPTKNHHPTVKPIALMEYLIKMVTKEGGTVLDPFAGSGTTLVAAKQNGYDYVGIELTEEYIPIIEARLSAVKENPKTLF